jgi:hypothetical protein
MNSAKRIGWLVILVVLGGHWGAPLALAGKYAIVGHSTTFKLVPPVGAPEPKASAQWTLRRDPDTEDVTVSCRGLTPDRQYTVVVLVDWTHWVRVGYDVWPIDSGSYSVELAVTADVKGRLNAQYTVESTWSQTSGVTRSVQELWIENDQDNVVLE